MQRPEVIYKPLVETPEGKLVSILAGGGTVFRDLKSLEYREGEITYTPSGTPGIWVSGSLDEARSAGLGNKDKVGTLVVYEVLALGNLMPDFLDKSGMRSLFSNYIRYPAILLGKEVWREEPKEEVRPEPKFKVGDEVFIHGGSYTIEAIIWSLKQGERFYQPDEVGHYHYLLSSTLTFDERILTLVPPKPVEEWVDVTEECTLQLHKGLLGVLVEIVYEGRGRLWLGANGIVHPNSGKKELPIEYDGYRIALSGKTTSDGATYFSIFRRELRDVG